MSLINQICATSRAAGPRIVMSEGEDPRIADAAIRAVEDGLAHIALVGDEATIRRHIAGSTVANQIEVHDPAKSAKLDAYADTYFSLRKHKGIDRAKAHEVMRTGLGYAAMMLRHGDADGTIGGAVSTTADTVRAAIQIVGKAADADVVSSCFLMLLGPPYERPVIFADCGLIPQPNDAELASIALASAQSLRALADLEPKIAMLSFSTLGSVDREVHESIERIHRAMDIVRERNPHIIIEGEVQFDAAIVPDIALRKAPHTKLAGAANIFVFPSLSAGNIGYKIAQRLGGAIALVPVLQGLEKPANDLSRGCSAQDVYQMIAITGAQVAARQSANAA